MRSESARAPLWESLEASTADEARRVLESAGAGRDEMVAGLELLADVADATDLAGVATAARARVAVVRSIGENGPVDLPPFPEGSEAELARALRIAVESAAALGQVATAENAALMARDLYIELEGPVSRSFTILIANLSNIYTRAGLSDRAETNATLALKLAGELAA
ncbi:MAG: hypothetical protein M3P18_24715 [Actinomycetota bacterium]|nr:hypothetical protein [Actinomycetota bacterium]